MTPQSAPFDAMPASPALRSAQARQDATAVVDDSEAVRPDEAAGEPLCGVRSLLLTTSLYLLGPAMATFVADRRSRHGTEADRLLWLPVAAELRRRWELGAVA